MNIYWGHDQSVCIKGMASYPYGHRGGGQAFAEFWVYRSPVGSASVIEDATLAEIISFSKLAPGWHYGEGGPIPQKTIDMALSLVAFIRKFGVWEIDAFAGCGGEISLVSTHNGYDVEAIVEGDGSVSVACDFDGRQVSYKPHLNYWEAAQEILAIVGKAWSTSEYFTHEITTSNDSGLPASHFATYAEAYLSSSMIAYDQPARTFRPIFEPTTTTLPLTQPSFGNLMDQYCPPLTP